MDSELKEDIIKILMAFYKIPGQYAIAGIILIGFWEVMRDLTNWSIFFLIFAIFFFVLEIISPILAGVRLYNNAIKWIKNLFN